MRSTAANAQLALLLEVAGTPKPGNVDRHREYEDLRFEHFVAGAVGARQGFRLAARGEPIGQAFERAIEGMAQQSGGNTQFGAVLMITPLVAASAADATDPEGVERVVAETTVADAANFYRAFDHVDVAVDPPPETLADLDVRRGSDAVPAVREREIPLGDLMAESAEGDGVAREWTEGFPRTFATADAIMADEGPVADRTSGAFIDLLASKPDTFVVTQHDRETADEVCERATAVIEGEEDAEAFADELVERGINPGTTADVVAAALFVALERGLDV